MIRFEHVSKRYKDGTVAIDNLNLEIQKGELLVLIGPSGCGKTTTMRMINRLIEPTSGTITIDGEDISRIDPVELRRNIGYVIQEIGLFPHMTIEENIALVPKLKKWHPDRYEKRVNELLDLVGLDPETYKDRYPSELSGGQQQRVGVIRALAGEPDIILMDEPFSALDPISREQLQEELVNLQESIRKTIVFVTHDMDEAIRIASRIAIMNNGKLVQVDSPDRILRRPANDFVRGFIGEERLNGGSVVPTARDLMHQSPVTVSPKRGLAEAFRIMKEKKVDSLFVIDNQRQLLGSVTLERVDQHYEQEDCTVADIMETEIPILTIDTPVNEVAEVFRDGKQNAIPVVEGKRLIGVVTRSSMMRGLADWTHHQSEGSVTT
ncbi:betaine/proline/choline family ABC transporter ATP-binding protein [Polycladomyces sp. WAk]|uniref:Quaternary amine transport ATP-binding protein n=1 Tax=Polycladomyces zharkentensis TaxID=2807616 RepID=A0ABS2WLC6_9BACL|nr:betaine/proline/choline family ABC transporter ATP-binding protein [Polycladomyces sp. WAk]MBN2910333.1 betaine/proline/choline family ABC transporter ATP-binding protein [Polycladomyces sp. WAk]